MDKTEYIPRIKIPRQEGNAQDADKHASKSPTEVIRVHPEGSWEENASNFPSQYALAHKIGEGGMGFVYLARDNTLGRHVAVKRLKRPFAVRSSFSKRFFREAKTIAALSHAHIVHIYNFSHDPPPPYIVMEYVEGPGKPEPDNLPAPPYTLTDKIGDEGPMSLSNALQLLIKLSHAVGYAHSRNVIHRDLKPANILFDKNGEPKIVDFGLARRLLPEEEPVTVPGEKMLSMGYGAPEQESATAPVDERADIYGLGAILYFCITAENPRYFRPHSIPEVLRDVLVKALETDRDKRWASARDFQQRLELIQAPSSIEFSSNRIVWHCKWCHASNPASIRYCADCGWDGTEYCLECGAETRIGIQFCGHCGADAREYELADNLQKRLERKSREKDYTFIMQHAGQISGFQPLGDSGRRIVENIHRLRRQAQQAQRRLGEIKHAIPREIEAGRFRMVRNLIDEYRHLSNDETFDSTERQLPEMAISHEIKRIHAALQNREWGQALRLSQEAGAAWPDVRNIGRLRWRARLCCGWARLRTATIVSALVMTLYLLAAPPAYRRSHPEAPPRFFGLAAWIYKESFLHEPLRHYAALWGVEHMPMNDGAGSPGNATLQRGNAKEARLEPGVPSARQLKR